MDDDSPDMFPPLKEEPDSDNESLNSSSVKSDKLLWTSSQTMALINMYKNDCPELWDTKHYRSNKATRDAKLEYLAEAFKTTAEEISRKLHNLRTQFNHQMRKIKRRRADGRWEGGEVVVGWEYFEALSFLLPATSSEPFDNEGVNLALAEFQAKEEEEFGAAARANNSLQSSGPSNKESSDTGSDKPKPLTTTASDVVLPLLGRRTSGHRVAASGPLPPPPSANPLLWAEEPVPRIRPSVNADECQIFGDFVASELRTLRSDESRKKLKRMIQKAILQVGEEEDVNIITTG